MQAELADALPRNLLVSGEVIEEMAQREPATLEALKQALADNKAALIGGEYAEIRLAAAGARGHRGSPSPRACRPTKDIWSGVPRSSAGGDSD